MLHLFRNNSPYTVLILFIFTLLVKLQALAVPQLPAVTADHVFYEGVLNIFDVLTGRSAFGYTMFAVIMIFGQALLLNAITVRYRLFGRPTYLVAFAYILLTSLHPSFSYFSEALVHNWFLIGAFYALLSFHQTNQPRKQIYNAGFLLSCAAIVHFPAAVFLILLFATLILLRSFNAGEWIVSLMGYLTPLYFFAGVLFIIDRFPAIKLWPHTGFAIPAHFKAGFYAVTVIVGLVVLLILGLYVMQGQMQRSAVFLRRSWVMISVAFLLSVVASGATDATIKNGWLIMMPALSLIVAQPLSLEKSKRFSNFTFYFSLLFIIICQVAYNY
ncbi:hypothetical protein [Polluticoccus soli]|uniref:hypothetical protein n=1 Tax=Polluticoccus soli TaxID=3034150 RepID=UPI0023E2C716|nr:hypothetical protein [Flavipsychrobacter sp. JY13-12]